MLSLTSMTDSHSGLALKVPEHGKEKGSLDPGECGRLTQALQFSLAILTSIEEKKIRD